MLVGIGKLGQEQAKADPRQSCDGIIPAEIKNGAAPQTNMLAVQTPVQEARGLICLLPTKGK